MIGLQLRDATAAAHASVSANWQADVDGDHQHLAADQLIGWLELNRDRG